MYTVILVEDEYLTREEIAKTTDFESLGLKLIGTADNGLSGLKLIQDLDPDIVITDIRLPGMDGLSMLSHCSVSASIILSGHTDFSYTKQAIRLGVFDYLQKPFDDEELCETLKRVITKLDEEKKDIEILQKDIDLSTNPRLKLPKNVGNLQVDSAISFIEKNYFKAIGLKEASEFVNLSESHLSRLFKEISGLNFLQYLNAYRINEALKLMKNPKYNITEISLSCGFPNPSYFAKIFKKFTNCSPSQYRDS